MHSLEVNIEGLGKRRKSIALFHVIIGLFLMSTASEFFKMSGYKALTITILVLGIAVLTVIYGAFRSKIDPAAKYNTALRWLQAATFILLFTFSISRYSLFIWACVCIIFLFTERKLFQNPLLIFSDQKIILPGYVLEKSIYWDELEHFVIRPDFVTIQYNGNRYVQYEVKSNMTASELKSIDAFCQQQMGKVALLKLK